MGLSSVASLAGLPRTRSAPADRSRDQDAGEEVQSTRRYLLLFRFALLNAAMFAFLLAAIMQGWLDQVGRTDVFHVVKLIILVFLVGLYQCGSRIFQVSQELNQLASDPGATGTRAGDYLRSLEGRDREGRSLLASSLKLKLATRLGHIRFIASTLVMLGLIGTVIGFIVALSGVDPNHVGEPNAVGPMVSTLLLGMGMAMYKTLAGIVCNIWLLMNYRLLEHGTVHFYTQLIELGEKR